MMKIMKQEKNKYQEALDIIKANEDEFYTIESVWKAIDTIQELIDSLYYYTQEKPKIDDVF